MYHKQIRARHFAQQCQTAPLEVPQIPSRERVRSRQLLITLHRQKVAFFQPSDGYDAVPRLPCHITRPLFVILADEWEQNTGEIHHVGLGKRWEGKTNTHWFYILCNIVTSVLLMFVTGNKLYTSGTPKQMSW